jgi:Domain of unknown function (DUF3883)
MIWARPVKAVAESGEVLDAEFGVEMVDDQLTVVLESRSGDGRNPDYHSTLLVLLGRLAELDASIVNAIVDSTVSRRVPFEDRQLQLRDRTYPVRIREEGEIDDLRIAIGAAQEPVAQRSGARGGNRHKRIRLYVDLDLDEAELQSRLASGAADAHEISGAVGSLTEFARPSYAARGQGRGLTGAERKAVEMRGMDLSRDALTRDGWSVENVSASRSYDLHCSRGDEEMHVEVKATTGVGANVLLTRNEVRHAGDHAGTVALHVISQVELDRQSKPPAANGGVLRRFEPWQLASGVLDPVAYEWVLPPPN